MQLGDYLKEKLLTNFNEPVTSFYVYWFKAIVASLYLWKLLSRDFSNVALWPVSIVSGYPADIYSPDYTQFTAIPPFFDLVTFHFIHFIFPFPGEGTLSLVQNLAIFLCVLLAILPLKNSRPVAIALYVLVAYLWGYVFRLGQEIDAVFLIQGALFSYCLVPYEKSVVYYRKIRFLVLIIFVIYYFTSGLNKIIDLSYSEWLQFDLININKSFNLRYNSEGYQWVPKFPILPKEILIALNFYGAFITYVIHVTCPSLLFTAGAKKVVTYWFFYSVFHFLTVYVGILFTMNFVAWLLVLPVYRWRALNERE